MTQHFKDTSCQQNVREFNTPDGMFRASRQNLYKMQPDGRSYVRVMGYDSFTSPRKLYQDWLKLTGQA